MNSKKITPVNLFFLAAIIFFAAGYIIYPFISLIKEISGVTEKGSFEIISISIFNSVFLAAISVAGSCLIGLYFAYFFRFKKFPLKNFFLTLLLMPIAAPPLVGVVAFLFLLNENGLITKIILMLFNLQSAPFRFDGWTAMIIVHIYSFYPFFLLFASSAFQKMDVNLIDASHSLGASKSKTFFKIILPQLMPAITGASLIVFMASMASFSAPFIFGGTSRFLTTEIYSAKINGDVPLAALLSIILTVISLAFLILLRTYRRRNTFENRTRGTVKFISHQTQSKIGAAGICMLAVFVFLIILPVLALMFLSLIPEGSLMRNYFSETFSLVNYEKIFGDPQFFKPFSNSVIMSVIAVAITIVIGLSAAFLTERKKIKGGNLLEGFLSIPYGIPGTVIALSFILSFNSPTLFTAFVPIAGTFWIIPLAYAVRNLPVLTQSSIAGFSSIDPSLEEASASLGAGGSRTFRKIILPLAAPSILSGALLVFINSVGEFVSTILLYTFSTKTISVEIYSQLRLYNTGAAAAYGVILFLLVIIIVFISRKLSRFNPSAV